MYIVFCALTPESYCTRSTCFRIIIVMAKHLLTQHMPYDHPIWQDHRRTRWRYADPHGVHQWNVGDEMPDHFLQRHLHNQHWEPTSDTEPLERYRIHGRLYRIPKYIRRNNSPTWSLLSNEATMRERRHHARFLETQQRGLYCERNKPTPLIRKWPPHYYKAQPHSHSTSIQMVV